MFEIGQIVVPVMGLMGTGYIIHLVYERYHRWKEAQRRIAVLKMIGDHWHREKVEIQPEDWCMLADLLED